MAEGQHQKNIFLFARVPPSKLLGKAKRAGYCSPSVAQIGVFIRECDKRLFPCEGQPQDVPIQLPNDYQASRRTYSVFDITSPFDAARKLAPSVLVHSIARVSFKAR